MALLFGRQRLKLSTDAPDKRDNCPNCELHSASQPNLAPLSFDRKKTLAITPEAAQTWTSLYSFFRLSSLPESATAKFNLIDYRARGSFVNMKLSTPSSPIWYGKPDHENSNSLDVEPGYLKKLEAMEQDAPSVPYGSIPIGDLMRQTCGDSLLRTCIVNMSLYTPLIKNGSEAESGPAKAIVASIADTAAHYAWGRIIDALNKRGNKMTVEQLSRRIHECPDPTGPVPMLQSYGLPRARVLLGHDCKYSARS